MLFDLFWTFLVTGLVSFGGGYAMIPVIERQVVQDHGWMTAQAFSDVVALAGMSPGPIATNCAIFVGYQLAGWAGAIFTTAGMVFPSFLLVIIAAVFFYKARVNRWVESAFYGLRPIITGLILYGAISFSLSNGVIGPISMHTVFSTMIFICSLMAMMFLRMHPLHVILLSGLTSIAIFS